VLDNAWTVTDRVMQVEVEFLATRDGGRKSPVGPTGYRPLLQFEGSEQLVGMAELLFDDDRWVALATALLTT
jgi:hypothetical protein